jgi:hypothetical protein
MGIAEESAMSRPSMSGVQKLRIFFGGKGGVQRPWFANVE